MINIYEEIQEGQLIENDYTGNQYEVTEAKDNVFTIERADHTLKINLSEAQNKYSFICLSDLY